VKAGADATEIHAAHGYILGVFLNLRPAKSSPPSRHAVIATIYSVFLVHAAGLPPVLLSIIF
jgi:hypothetical protein